MRELDIPCVQINAIYIMYSRCSILMYILYIVILEAHVGPAVVCFVWDGVVFNDSKLFSCWGNLTLYVRSLFWNIKMNLHFVLFWNTIMVQFIWNPSWWNKRTWLFCNLISIMVADDLATFIARSSAAMVLTKFAQIFFGFWKQKS